MAVWMSVKSASPQSAGPNDGATTKVAVYRSVEHAMWPSLVRCRRPRHTRCPTRHFLALRSRYGRPLLLTSAREEVLSLVLLEVNRLQKPEVFSRPAEESLIRAKIDGNVHIRTPGSARGSLIFPQMARTL